MKQIISVLLGIAIGGVAVLLAMKMRESPEPGSTTDGRSLVSAGAGELARPKDPGSPSSVAQPSELPSRPEGAAPPSAVATAALSMDRLLSENDHARSLHAAFLAQPQDPQLSATMEERWRQFYAGKPGLNQYGTPQVECGAKFCEIRLLANGTNTSLKWAQLLLSPAGNGNASPAGNIVSGAEMTENGATAVAYLVAH